METRPKTGLDRGSRIVIIIGILLLIWSIVGPQRPHPIGAFLNRISQIKLTTF